LAQAGATVRSDIEFVSDYIRRRRDEAGPVPCVLSLFVPDTWAEDVRRVALELGVGRAYLCRPGRESGPQVWMELAPQAAGWHTWLAATPMSVPERVQWCLDRLDAHPEMRGRDNLMYERDLLAHLGMPEAVAHELLAQACAPKSSRFKHLRTRDGEFYVKRVEAR
jgi:hypothetical protein